MITALDPAAAARTVVWGGLLLGLALGAVGQATRFCVRGAIDDWVRLRQPGRLVSWLLAIAVAAAAVQALIGLGLFDARRTVAWGSNFILENAVGSPECEPSPCHVSTILTARPHPFGTAPQMPESAENQRQCLLSAVRAPTNCRI